jgi:cytoskeletal protein RodZ
MKTIIVGAVLIVLGLAVVVIVHVLRMEAAVLSKAFSGVAAIGAAVLLVGFFRQSNQPGERRRMPPLRTAQAGEGGDKKPVIKKSVPAKKPETAKTADGEKKPAAAKKPVIAAKMPAADPKKKAEPAPAATAKKEADDDDDDEEEEDAEDTSEKAEADKA